MRLLFTWLIHAASLMILPYLLPSIHVRDFGTALIGALLLGLVNMFIRPILVLLTLPITLLTLGLFIFIINGFLFWLVSHWLGGLHVNSFGAALLASLVYSVISWTLTTLLTKK